MDRVSSKLSCSLFWTATGVGKIKELNTNVL